MQRETSQDIDEQAARWAARMDRGPLPAADEALLERWLAVDARRRGALLRAKAALMHSEAAIALGPRYDPDSFLPAAQPPAARTSRRRALGWGLAIAASLMAVVLFPFAMPGSTAYATERGEVRLVPLGDGSTVTLNTATRVRVRHGDARRLVVLLEGEAYFEVAPDPVRQFVVEVDGQRLSTNGASFLVRKLADAPVHVAVHDGRVELPERAGGGAGPAALEPQRRASLAPSGTRTVSGPVPRDELVRELAWREGKIAFHGESLAQAAEAFARYSRTRIVIDDPALAREPVTGLFAANDPAGFGRAVGRVFGADVEIGVDTVVIARAH